MLHLKKSRTALYAQKAHFMETSLVGKRAYCFYAGLRIFAVKSGANYMEI